MAMTERELARPLESTPGLYPLRVTKDQYYQLAELGWFEGKRVELIEGVIYEKMSPMSIRHAAAISIANHLFFDVFGHDHVVNIQIPLDSAPDSEPEPDIAIYTGRPRDYVKAKATTAVLVVEVALSSIKVDRRKAEVYARAGVSEYWIVNLDNDTLEIYREPSGERLLIGSGKYAKRLVLRRGDFVTPLSAPERSIPIADLLPDPE